MEARCSVDRHNERSSFAHRQLRSTVTVSVSPGREPNRTWSSCSSPWTGFAIQREHVIARFKPLFRYASGISEIVVEKLVRVKRNLRVAGGICLQINDKSGISELRDQGPSQQ